MIYFVYLKSWFLFLRFFFSSKNPFTFLGGGGGGGRGGGGSIYSTPRRGRGSMNLDGIQQGEGGGSRKRNFEGASKMYGPISINLDSKLSLYP